MDISISIFLAKVIGLFLSISTLAIILRYKEFTLIEKEAVKNPLLIYVSGFFTLISGILIVVSHNLWVLDWRLIITIIGWITLFKGIFRIFYPKAVIKLISQKHDNRLFLLAELLFFFVGLYLIYYGFFVY